MRDNNESRESNNAYSEDKVRYLFMEDNKPKQSEFLKTLIEKSHRKNNSAIRNIYVSINKKQNSTLRQSKLNKHNSSQTKRQKFITLRDSSEKQHSKDMVDTPTEINNKTRNFIRNEQSKKIFQSSLKKHKGKTRSLKMDIGLGYYLGNQIAKEKLKRANPNSLATINITDNLVEAQKANSKCTERNKSIDFPENKYHYLLNSFSRNKSHKKISKKIKMKTELMEEKEESQKFKKCTNYISMNCYSSPVDSLYGVDDKGNSLQNPIMKLGSGDYIASSSKRTHNISRIDISQEHYQITQKENIEDKLKKNKINTYIEILEKNCDSNDELEELENKITNIFKNWKKSSMAEFFEFKSSKGLYKIKVQWASIPFTEF